MSLTLEKKEFLIRQKRAIEAQKKSTSRKKQEIIDGLPHLYGRKWYWWAKQYFDSRNKVCLLTAANQISKSSTMIRKCIHWATSMKDWPEIFPNKTPRQFWYIYPSKALATSEFREKWVPEFLPRNEYKTHPIYGWTAEYVQKHISVVRFNSGVSVYFITHEQDLSNIQGSTVDAMFADEELPVDRYNEMRARLFGSDGYFHMVFTATLNQDFWKRAIEGRGEQETFKDAFKLQVSMFDCLVYIDGSATPWTEERIKRIIESCSSDTEVQRRVYGKFVTEQGRKYHAFDATRHFTTPKNIPIDWTRYAAVDYGGGGMGHPAAIVFLAVNPERNRGWIYRCWRGDNITTTSADILDKYRELRQKEHINIQVYDGQAKDFGTIAERQGEGFIKADKSHERGEDLLNALFQNGCLEIFDDSEGQKLGTELSTLMNDTPKTRAKDDLCDATRYVCMAVGWDLTTLDHTSKGLAEKPEVTRFLTDEEYAVWQIKQRRGEMGKKRGEDEQDWGDIGEEIDMWNDLAGC